MVTDYWLVNTYSNYYHNQNHLSRLPLLNYYLNLFQYHHHYQIILNHAETFLGRLPTQIHLRVHVEELIQDHHRHSLRYFDQYL